MSEEEIEKILRQPVTGIMIACPLPVSPDASLITVLGQFSRQGNHPLMVLEDDGTLAGVITPVDLISVLTPLGGSGERHLISGLDRFLKSTAQNAGDIMSDEPMRVRTDATLGDALREMEHAHSTSVIVVNEKNTAVGCIELADIIAVLSRSLSH
jgi:CBS-domain-containing membrane protein